MPGPDDLDAGLPPVTSPVAGSNAERMDAGLPIDPTEQMDAAAPLETLPLDLRSLDQQDHDRQADIDRMNADPPIHSDPWGNALVGAVATGGLSAAGGLVEGLAGAGEAAAEGVGEGLTEGATESQVPGAIESMSGGYGAIDNAAAQGSAQTAATGSDLAHQLANHALEHGLTDMSVDGIDHLTGTGDEHDEQHLGQHPGADDAHNFTVDPAITSHDANASYELNASYEPDTSYEQDQINASYDPSTEHEVRHNH